MQFKIIILFTIIGIISADIYYDLVHEQWNTFKLQHGKSYRSETEENYRFKIFITNMNRILKHNQQYELGKVSYKIGINQFADKFTYEINNMMTCINISAIKNSEFDNHANDGASFIVPENVVIPKEINWVENGAVTKVKDQGQCGSCYAFATTGALEGQHYRATNELISISEQNIVDCSKDYGNFGCWGGWMVNSYKYIIDKHYINTEKNYPYKGVEQTCQNIRKHGVTVKSYVELSVGDEEELMIAVATQGPIAIAMDASHDGFHFYTDGIYYDPDCTVGMVNHAVLIVGYGTDERYGDYWLVKNSWAETWGLNGYIKLARNRNNMCCVACYASYPLV